LIKTAIARYRMAIKRFIGSRQLNIFFIEKYDPKPDNYHMGLVVKTEWGAAGAVFLNLVVDGKA